MDLWESTTGLAGLLLGCRGEQAPSTLLLHGFTGAAEDWIEIGARSGPALALTLPGHGASADPRGSWDASVSRLLRALPGSIDRIVGYSLGGRIALGLAMAAPERFRSLVVVSAHPGLTNPAERIVRRATDRCWIELLRRDGVPGFVATWETLPLFDGQSRLPLEALARQRMRRQSHRAEGLMASMEVFGLAEMPDSREDLRRFPGRLQWIVGADDRKFLRLAQEVSALRSDIELVVLPGVGHNVLLEAPAELGKRIAEP